MINDNILNELNEINSLVKLIKNFLSSHANIDTAYSSDYCEFIAYQKKWYSSHKKILSTLKVSYGSYIVPDNCVNYMDNVSICICIDGSNYKPINNGLSKQYFEVTQVNAQASLKNELAANDYIKALIYVIDNAREAQRILDKITK